MADVCYWCSTQCGGTCLGVNHENGPRQMKTSDPAYFLLSGGHTSTPTVHRSGCYICEDPEYARMGLPLCKPCPECMRNAKNEGDMGHIPADEPVCDDCGYDLQEAYEKEQMEKQQ